MDWEKQLQHEVEEAQRKRTYLIAGQPFLTESLMVMKLTIGGANQVNLYDD